MQETLEPPNVLSPIVQEPPSVLSLMVPGTTKCSVPDGVRNHQVFRPRWCQEPPNVPSLMVPGTTKCSVPDGARNHRMFRPRWCQEPPSVPSPMVPGTTECSVPDGARNHRMFRPRWCQEPPNVPSPMVPGTAEALLPLSATDTNCSFNRYVSCQKPRGCAAVSQPQSSSILQEQPDPTRCSSAGLLQRCQDVSSQASSEWPWKRR